MHDGPATIIQDESGNRLSLVDGRLPVENVPNKISTTSFNSRDAATLAAAATFQGVGEDVSAYGRVGVSVKSDNATDGILTMETSLDNVTWSGPVRTWANTSIAQPHMWNIVEKYFRIKYVNGTTEATNLAIQVQYSNNADTLLGHQLDETLLNETEAIVTRSVLVGEDGAGVYRNASVDTNNHLDIVPHGHPEGGHVLFKKTFSATEDVIVIDLSDTTNYPHDYTSWIHSMNMILGIDASADAEYVIQLGFLKNVDSADGDFHEIFVVDGSRKAGNSHFFAIAQSPEAPQLKSSKFLGPVELNQTAFQTDVNLRSTLDPTGTAATPSGGGDMAMRVTHTAGTYTISLMIGYHSHNT